MSTAVSLALDSPELAAQYDVVGRRQLDHGKLLVSDLEIRPGQRVLDVGCGTGLLGAYVAGIVGTTGKVVGIDPLPLRVELARRRAGPSFEATLGRAEDLSPFAAASFDVVLLNSVLHWLPEHLPVLRQIARVLRPGGKVGFTSADRAQPHDLTLALERAFRVCGLADRAASAAPPRRVSRDEASALFGAAGLRETQVVARTFTDAFADVDAVLAFSRASSFGNHLAALSEPERTAVVATLGRELEAGRRGLPIVLRRHLVYAVAEKPRLECGCGDTGVLGELRHVPRG